MLSIHRLLTSRDDFIYVVPPFLSMHGAIQKDTTVMDETYSQVKLYRDVLRDSSGLWKCIIDEYGGLGQGTYTHHVLGVSISPIFARGRLLVN